MSVLEKENNIQDEEVSISFDINGDNYEVKMYPYFKPEKIRDLVNDLVLFYKNAEKEKLEVDSQEESDLIGYFLIKHFSNIKTTKSKVAKTIYKEFKTALNSVVIQEIIKTFPSESIEKVYTRIYEVIESGAKVKDIMEQNNELVALMKDAMDKENVSYINVLADKK